MPAYHFISGLPRAGSTLLSAILLQNPCFHAGMTSPVGTLYSGMLQQFGAGTEFGPVITTDERKRLVRGLFESYYANQTDKAVVFDTNRMWTAHLPMLMDQFPGSKVIACVRNVAWVMDSIERKYAGDPYEITRLFNNDTERATVYSRAETLAQQSRMVGYPWTALKSAFYSAHADSMLLIEYDLLAQAPHKVLPLIYQFIGVDPFTHDFERVAYDAPDFDAPLGMRGLHKVRPAVSLQARDTILPPDLFAQYSKLSFWKDTAGSRANVLAVKAADGAPKSPPLAGAPSSKFRPLPGEG